MSEWESWIKIVLWSAAFLSVGGWLLRYLWLRQRYQWPQGQRRSWTYEGYEVHVLTQGEAAPPELLSACAKAVAATAHGWILSGRSRPHARIGKIAVYFQSDAVFDTHRVESLRRAAAYLDKIPRGAGVPMPCAVIRTSLVTHVMETGDPLIHEMLCALDEWDPERDEPDTRELTQAGRGAHASALQAYLRSGGAN